MKQVYSLHVIWSKNLLIQFSQRNKRNSSKSIWRIPVFKRANVSGSLASQLKYPLMDACVDLITAVIEVNFRALSLEEYLKTAEED